MEDGRRVGSTEGTPFDTIGRVDALRTEGHDAGYDWRQRFPKAERILQGEGSAIYLAEGEGAWWVISDAGTFAGLHPDEDLGPLIHLTAFASKDDAHRCIALTTAESTGDIARIMLRRAAPEIARALEAAAADGALTTIKETPHLQSVVVSVLQCTNPLVATPLAVAPQAPHGLEQHWPRLGRVDVALGTSPFLPAFVELKCGDGANALGPCAWDALKIACALRLETTSAGFLVTATTAEMWRRPVRGSELLGDGEWTAEGLRQTYADWWAFWEKDGATSANPAGYRPPPRVPAAFGTMEIGEPESFRVGNTPWELRMSEVVLRGQGWFAWEPLRA